MRDRIFGGVVGYLVGSLLMVPGYAQQQVPVANAGDKLCWDQPAQSLSEAQGFTYTLQFDVTRDAALANAKAMSQAKKTGAAPTPRDSTGMWVNVSCSAVPDPATPTLFNCLTAIPTSLSAGQHSVWVTAESQASLSATSDPLVFVFSGTANMKPANLRITKGQ